MPYGQGLIETASNALSYVGAKVWGTPTNNPVLAKESLADELFDRSNVNGMAVTNPKLLPRHQREAMQARVDALVQWMEDPKTKEQYEGSNPEPILVDQPLEPQSVKKEKREARELVATPTTQTPTKKPEPGLRYQFECHAFDKTGWEMWIKRPVTDCQLPVVSNGNAGICQADGNGDELVQYQGAVAWCSNEADHHRGETFFSVACQDNEVAKPRDCTQPPYQAPPCGVKEIGGCGERDWFVVSEPFVTEDEGGPQYLYDNARNGHNNPPSAAGAYPDPSHGGEITFGFEISADYLKEHASLNNPKSVLNLIRPFSDKHNDLLDYCDGNDTDYSCPPEPTVKPTENEGEDGYTTTQKIGLGAAAGLGAFGVSFLTVGVASATYKNCKKPSEKKEKDIELAETKPEIDIVPLEKPKDLVITNVHAEDVVVV